MYLHIAFFFVLFFFFVVLDINIQLSLCLLPAVYLLGIGQVCKVVSGRTTKVVGHVCTPTINRCMFPLLDIFTSINCHLWY